MYLLVHKSGMITLQSGGEVNIRLGVIGHKKEYYGVQALNQNVIPIVYAQ